MADIKQAARWMQQGKRVEGGDSIYPLSAQGSYILFHPSDGESGTYSMGTLDLLAEDWEIADSNPPASL